MEQIPKPHDMAVCPYNKAHVVDHYRMHIHTIKCSKQHPNAKTVKCQYDSVHVVDETQKHYHASVCSKRHMLDNMMYVTDDDHRPVVPVAKPDPIANTEDWDNEQSSSYVPDPWKNPHIIKKIKGATKSERRKARMEGVKSYKPNQPPEN